MGMSFKERRSMRLAQIERLVASGMSVAEWCKLNHVGESTIYEWMKRFREEGLYVCGDKSTGEWIELSRKDFADKTALATTVAQKPLSRFSATSTQHADENVQTASIAVSLNGAVVSVPAGAAESDVALVLRAVASL